MLDDSLYLQVIRTIYSAGQAILEIYDSDFKVEHKQDHSPLTEADRRAHKVIHAGLEASGLPLLSEEGKTIPYEERRRWQLFWLVDPLDGTKEFVKRNGEFTVNIALIENGVPLLGLVYVPVTAVLYIGDIQRGAFRWQDMHALAADLDQHSDSEALANAWRRAEAMPLVKADPATYCIVGSRSHGTPELEAFVAAKRQEYASVNFLAAGSSLKFCLVAEGRADIYPRFGPTMEWDTAAGQAVVNSAGGKVYRYDTRQPLTYNKESLLNPWFIVERPTASQRSFAENPGQS